VILEVKVKARSSQQKIIEPARPGEPWVIFLREAPEKGKANEAVRELLAERFGKPKSFIQILRGETSKLKQVEIKET
jgi:hypothetical protein